MTAPMVSTRVCCARCTVHVVRNDAVSEGVELTVVIGSSDPNMSKGDRVMLVDPDNNVVSAADLKEVPELGRAVGALFTAAMAMFGRDDLRASSLPKSDGVKH